MGTFQCFEKSLFSPKHCGLRPSIQAWGTTTHSPTVRERERGREKNHWPSCGHVTFSITYYLYCKTLLVYQVKMKCWLVLRNTRKTSYSQSKVLLYYLWACFLCLSVNHVGTHHGSSVIATCPWYLVMNSTCHSLNGILIGSLVSILLTHALMAL